MTESTLPTHAQFAENLDTIFLLELDEQNTVEVTLVEVSELKESRSQHRFSLLFKGPPNMVLVQHQYAMRHETLGYFPLFLVPVNVLRDGFFYEAIFNLLRNADSVTEPSY